MHGTRGHVCICPTNGAAPGARAHRERRDDVAAIRQGTRDPAPATRAFWHGLGTAAVTMPGLRRRALLAAFLVLSFAARDAAARAPGDPVRLVWTEGDIAGMSSVYAPDGTRPIGSIEDHQHREGDV